MSRQPLLRAGLRALLQSLLLTSVFALGSGVAIYLYPHAIAEVDDHDDEHHDDELDLHHDEEEEEDHVALTEQAYANLALKMGPAQRQDYWKTLLVPARVVEIPGRSDLSVSAPVTGVVEEVKILPGETLTADAPLFSIRLTDETVIDAQSKLLETLTLQDITEQEIARLNPLTDSGAVSRAKIRELEYELKQQKAQQSTLIQELRSRGLPQPIISDLLKKRELATTLSVLPPSFIDDETISETKTSGYSVEELAVHPGKSVSRGDQLCSVAYHSKLYLEGTAFEDDLSVLDRIVENEWKVTVEQHTSDHAHSNSLRLELLRVDNHVDEETQTVKFFIELPNEVARRRLTDGKLFEQWRFRPGQRLHLRLPVERWENQLTLPIDAVVVDGPNAFVFAEHHHENESAASGQSSKDAMEPETDTEDHGEEDDDHEDHDVFIELEPIPVRLLHRDDKTAVIADDGQVLASEHVALNNAYKLYLAMKMQSGGGGGHHHHHDH